MARIAGRLSRLEVSEDGGTNFTLVGCVTDMNLSSSGEDLDATCKESGQFREYLSGRKSGEISGTTRWDGDDAGQAILRKSHFDDIPVTVRFRLEERAGQPEYTVRARVRDLDMQSPNDDIVSMDVTLRLSGDYSEGIQA